jgi:hypothetical protein
MSKPLIEDHSPLSKLLGKMPLSYAPMSPPSSSRAPSSLSGPHSSASSLWSLQTHCTRSLFMCGVVIWCICRSGWSSCAPIRGSSGQGSRGSIGSYQAPTCSVAAQGEKHSHKRANYQISSLLHAMIGHISRSIILLHCGRSPPARAQPAISTTMPILSPRPLSCHSRCPLSKCPHRGTIRPSPSRAQVKPDSVYCRRSGYNCYIGYVSPFVQAQRMAEDKTARGSMAERMVVAWSAKDIGFIDAVRGMDTYRCRD